VLYESKDMVVWKRAEHLLVSDLELHWKDRPMQRVKRMERAQLSFDAAGNPTALLVAITDDGPESYNVRIPLLH
jgi:hypothetical protein